MYQKSLTDLFVETILDSYSTGGGFVAGRLRAQERRSRIRTDTRCLCVNPANSPHNKASAVNTIGIEWTRPRRP